LYFSTDRDSSFPNFFIRRHDSGSTSCFDLLPKVKPKKRRSLRNLLRSKIPADEAVVSYPVNPKEDEAAYSAIGQKLANHSCESLSGY